MKLTEKPRLFLSKQGDYFLATKVSLFDLACHLGEWDNKRGSWSWAEITHVWRAWERDSADLYRTPASNGFFLKRYLLYLCQLCVADKTGGGIVWRWQPLHHAWLLHLLAVDSGSRTADTAVPGGRGQPWDTPQAFLRHAGSAGPQLTCKSSSRANH